MDSLFQEVQAKLISLAAQSITAFPGFVLALVVLVLTRTVANFAQKGAEKLAKKTFKSLSLQSLFVRISYSITWAIGSLVACILAFPDLGLSDLIALLGLGSVAIGFAFQDIFKNFLAGILLLLQEPFSIGDQIIVSSFEGTVEEIALRSTQIRTYQGEQVLVPNSIVFSSPVQVMTANPKRRTDVEIGIDYNTPLVQAIRKLLDAVNSVEGVMSIPSAEVDISGLGSSSIDLSVRYWTHPEQKCVRRTKTQVILALKAACDQAGISIPYPIRTVYHFDQQQYDDAQPIGEKEQESRTPLLSLGERS